MKITWKNLQRGDIVAGVCAAGAVLPAFALAGTAVPAYVVGVLLGCFVAVTRHRYMAGLQQRVRASDRPDWDVELNGVRIGTVSDAEYAAIRLTVFANMRLYAAQLLNCCRVMIRVLDSMLQAVPLLAIWGLLLAALFAPALCADMLNQIRGATPASIGNFARAVFGFMTCVGILAAALNAVLMGARYGFVNRFSEATANALRKHFGVAAEGDITLVRWVNGVAHINDERQALRR